MLESVFELHTISENRLFYFHITCIKKNLKYKPSYSILFEQPTPKVLIRLYPRSYCSVSLLFAHGSDRFSQDEVQIILLLVVGPV